MTDKRNATDRADRSPGPSVQDIVSGDKVPAPPVLRHATESDLGTAGIDQQRYVSQQWHDLEVEHLWKRVWQVACREEELVDVGDTIVYDIADSSLILVRSNDGKIRAFHNSCLHRGAVLRDDSGPTPEFRCPFHGFTWALDGKLADIPCEWDFAHVDKDDFCLPEALVDTWGGWVFINLDTTATPLSDHLGGFVDSFIWDQENLRMRVHVEKILPCNWKVALEAFIESYHVIATHPQLLVMTGDANTQYDVFDDEPTWNRMVTLQGVTSPHHPDLSEQEIMDGLLAQFMGDGVIFPIPEGETARGMLAELMRAQMRPWLGDDAEVSDSEALDSIEYYVFPNFVPWGGFTHLNYRFRPHNNDPNMCVMDVMMLAPFNPDAPRPRPAKVQRLGLDDPWTDAPDLGPFAAVFTQDSGNFGRIQRGLRASVQGRTVMGSYQEVRIRHYHQELGRWIGDEQDSTGS